MHLEINKPIFVVGSPRSGTSVLAWCLGHHPNIFPVPESNWMGDFAVNVAISYQVGAARGIFSILSAMGISRDEFFSHIGRSINSLVLKHRCDLDRTRLITGVQRLLKKEGLYFGEVTGELDAATSAAIRQYGIADDANGLVYSELVDSLRTAASDSEYKTRWVDQTPEYSFHICGLRKLFPCASFIHIVRDVDSVVRSMLNFHRIAGTHMVANEEEGYKYWLRTVRACLKAEEAYGPKVVRRLLYSTLIEDPELAIQSVLNFVGEPYSAGCLEPLGDRINSSNVPPGFKSDDRATDPRVVEEARRLSAEIEKTAQPSETSVAAADELESAFQESCLKAMTIERELTNQIARQEEQYNNRLRKKYREIQQLTAMLDEVAASTTSLLSSKVWTFANMAGAIGAKVLRKKAPRPDRRFQKIVAKYVRWRASHIANADEPFQMTESPLAPKSSDAQPEALSEIQSIPKIFRDSANK
jgi:Sulfotransferase family